MPRKPLLPVRLLHALAPRVEPFTRPALIVAPHPDDETFGCGGVIAHKCQNGVRVKVAFMTDGSRSHGELDGKGKADLVALRQREGIAACATLGVPVEDIIFFELPDGGLSKITESDREAAVDRLRGLLDAISAEEVYVTYRRDRHRDHEVSFALAAAAVARAGRSVELYEYPIWVQNGLNRWLQRVGLRQYRTARAVPLSAEVLAKKRVAVAAHASQLETLPKGFEEMFLTGRELFFVSRIGH